MKTSVYLLALIILTACAADVTEPAAAITTPRQPTSTRINQVGAVGAGPALSGSPSDIVMQYDVLGGLMGGGPGTQLPQRTLYGDGLLVWTEEGAPTPGFSSSVWVGHVTQSDISGLMALLDESGFWGLESSYLPEPFVTESTPPAGAQDGLTAIVPNPEAALDQPTGVLMAEIGDRRQQVTVFPAEWAQAPQAYLSVRQRLLEIRPADAVPFSPDSFSLRARELPQTAMDVPDIPDWPFEISLDSVVKEPVMLANDIGITVAAFIQANGQRVAQDGTAYLVTLLAESPR